MVCTTKQMVGGDITNAGQQTNNEQGKIGLLSQQMAGMSKNHSPFKCSVAYHKQVGFVSWNYLTMQEEQDQTEKVMIANSQRGFPQFFFDLMSSWHEVVFQLMHQMLNWRSAMGKFVVHNRRKKEQYVYSSRAFYLSQHDNADMKHRIFQRPNFVNLTLSSNQAQVRKKSTTVIIQKKGKIVRVVLKHLG